MDENTNPLNVLANAKAAEEQAKTALLARLEEIKAEAKSIKAALGRTRKPRAAKVAKKADK